MNWIHRFKSNIRHVLAVQLREIVRYRLESTLRRLDDRSLANIGIPHGLIAEYAREVAHKTVPVAAKPTPARKRNTERKMSWWERRAAIREFSALDGRLLRDIGAGAGRVDAAIDAAPSQRRDLGTADAVVQLSNVKVCFERTPDAHASPARAANESQSSEWRLRALAGR